MVDTTWSVNYSYSLVIKATRSFTKWIDGLKDRAARAQIAVRIDRLALGHEGDAKSVGGGVRELRIQAGPGYRVYFAQRGEEMLILLVGGSKGTQERDIAKAKKLLEEWQ